MSASVDREERLRADRVLEQLDVDRRIVRRVGLRSAVARRERERKTSNAPDPQRWRIANHSYAAGSRAPKCCRRTGTPVVRPGYFGSVMVNVQTTTDATGLVVGVAGRVELDLAARARARARRGRGRAC